MTELRLNKLNHAPGSVEYKSVMDTAYFFSFDNFCKNYLRVGARERQESDYSKSDFWVKLDDYHTHHYENVIIDGCAIAYDEQHQPIKEALNTYDDIDHFVRDKGCKDFSGIKRIDTEKAPILFFDHYFYNFTHFVFEAFPRLFLVKDLVKQGHKMLLPPRPKKGAGYDYYIHIQPCLDSIGITAADMIEIPAEGAFFPQLIMPSHVKFQPDVVLPAINHLKNYFFEADFKWDHENLYISRDDTKLRNITNKHSVEFIVCRYFNFKRVVMSELSFKDKINIMARTQCVVSVDSSSLTNAMFMDQKTKILALRPYCFGFYGIPFNSLFDLDIYFQVCPFGTTDTSHFTGHLLVDLVKLFDNVMNLLPHPYQGNLVVKIHPSIFRFFLMILSVIQKCYYGVKNKSWLMLNKITPRFVKRIVRFVLNSFRK